MPRRRRRRCRQIRCFFSALFCSRALLYTKPNPNPMPGLEEQSPVGSEGHISFTLPFQEALLLLRCGEKLGTCELRSLRALSCP